MKILFQFRQISVPVEPLFQEVFNCLHIMVSRALNFFDAFSVCYREIREDFVHKNFLSRHFGYCSCVFCHDLLAEEGLEPTKLNVDSEAHQSIFREVGPKRVTASGVATVNRADGCQRTDRGYRFRAEERAGLSCHQHRSSSCTAQLLAEREPI